MLPLLAAIKVPGGGHSVYVIEIKDAQISYYDP